MVSPSRMARLILELGSHFYRISAKDYQVSTDPSRYRVIIEDTI